MDFQGLSAHFRKIIRKNLQGNRLGADDFQGLAGETLVIIDARFPHEGGIGGQSGDVGLLVIFGDAGQVGAVGE